MRDNNIIQEAIDCLKRLHKENAELKAYKDVNEDFKTAWQELKAENERLKEERNKLGKKHEDYCNTMYWQMKEQMDKYRKTLQEIKTIAEENKDTSQYSGICKSILNLIAKSEIEEG